MVTWITADWHLGESRLEIMGRPFSSPTAMIETLVENHNALVGPEDEVIVVGDVCNKNTPEYLHCVERFNGQKTLIRGNHDRPISDKEFAEYFYRILPEGEGVELDIEGILCYITHYPTRGMMDRFNLVGHIHSAWKYQLNMLNVGVDVHHFRPVSLNSIPFHFKAICEYYDDDVWIAYSYINSYYHQYEGRGRSGSYFTPKVRGS